MPLPSPPPMSTEVPRGGQADGNVAAIYHGQHVPTAVSKAAW